MSGTSCAMKLEEVRDDVACANRAGAVRRAEDRRQICHQNPLCGSQTRRRGSCVGMQPGFAAVRAHGRQPLRSALRIVADLP